MRNAKVLTVLLAAGLAFSTPLIANAKNAKGDESQKGGLPALEDRVDADEVRITTLEGEVAALLGQNQFAVVSAAGAIVRSSPGVTIEAHTAATGAYELTFNKNVTGCAYVATLGDTANGAPPVGEVSVSGDTDTDNTHDVFVQTANSAGVAADASFHLYVSCP
jgi:hypothetical protein